MYTIRRGTAKLADPAESGKLSDVVYRRTDKVCIRTPSCKTRTLQHLVLKREAKTSPSRSTRTRRVCARGA